MTFQNLAGSDFCYNQSYQAGISALGNTDYIYNNYVLQGGGYGPSACGLGIDVTGSTNVQSGGNNVPLTGLAAIAPALQSASRSSKVQADSLRHCCQSQGNLRRPEIPL